VRKWLACWRGGGEPALDDRSSAPARQRRLPAEQVAAIEALRRPIRPRSRPARPRRPSPLAADAPVAESIVNPWRSDERRQPRLIRHSSADATCVISRYGRSSPAEGPAGTQGSGDIDQPSAATGRARSIGDRAASEIDAPGPRPTPSCGGRTRQPRTEEWPLPDHHPRSQRQLGVLDPAQPDYRRGLYDRVGVAEQALRPAPAPSEPYVQVSPHTARASASACEVDREDRP
jgi:hypothetical protein